MTITQAVCNVIPRLLAGGNIFTVRAVQLEVLKEGGVMLTCKQINMALYRLRDTLDVYSIGNGRYMKEMKHEE
jgi:hypothetical protein